MGQYWDYSSLQCHQPWKIISQQRISKLTARLVARFHWRVIQQNMGQPTVEYINININTVIFSYINNRSNIDHRYTLNISQTQRHQWWNGCRASKRGIGSGPSTRSHHLHNRHILGCVFSFQISEMKGVQASSFFEALCLFVQSFLSRSCRAQPGEFSLMVPSGKLT